MKYLISTLLISILLFQISCTGDEQEIVQNIDDISTANGFYILNEGGFTHNNASLDFYDYETDQISSSIYEAVNQAPLGDVFQSAYIYQNELFLVLNNSSKVLRLDENHNQIAEISGLESPRYMAFNDQTAYVSDLYANKINIIDLQSNEISGNIACSGWTEELLLIDQYLIACLPNESKIYLIDTEQALITDSMDLSGRASSVEMDTNGNIWVLGGGDYQGTIAAGLHQLSVSSGNLILEKSFDLGIDSGLFPELCMNTERDSLFYVLENSIYALPVSATTISSSPLFSIPFANIYGLAYHPEKKEIIIADAVDYVQQGWIYRYTSSGQQKGQYSVGIIPNGFLFTN